MAITFHPNGDITGTGASNFGQTGTVLQTVHTFSTTKIETSDDADIISATITPSSTSSKILFMYNGNVAQENNSGLEWGFIAYRGSTQIRIGRNESGNNRLTFQAFGTDNRAAADNSNGTYTITGVLLDEPNTTSAVTYKLAIEQFYTSGTRAIVKVGESGWSGTGGEQNNNGYSFTLMEIKG